MQLLLLLGHISLCVGQLNRNQKAAKTSTFYKKILQSVQFFVVNFLPVSEVSISLTVNHKQRSCSMAKIHWSEKINWRRVSIADTHTHPRLTALCPGLPGWAGTRKVKPIWILLEQQTVSRSGISWAICKSAPRFRQITMPAPHHSFFYRPDALPDAKPTASKHWRQV